VLLEQREENCRLDGWFHGSDFAEEGMRVTPKIAISGTQGCAKFGVDHRGGLERNADSSSGTVAAYLARIKPSELPSASQPLVTPFYAASRTLTLLLMAGVRWPGADPA